MKLKYFFPLVLLCAVGHAIAGCSTISKSWQYRGDKRAQGVRPLTLYARDILKNSVESAQNCILSSSQKIKKLDYIGEIKIENGMMFISKFQNTEEVKNSDIQKCMQMEIAKKKWDVAHGIKYNPAVLEKDVYYQFKGRILPMISGSVFPVEFPDRVESF